MCKILEEAVEIIIILLKNNNDWPWKTGLVFFSFFFFPFCLLWFKGGHCCRAASAAVRPETEAQKLLCFILGSAGDSLLFFLRQCLLFYINFYFLCVCTTNMAVVNW